MSPQLLRREFLKSMTSALGLIMLDSVTGARIALASASSVYGATVASASNSSHANNGILVYIFARGALDGLSVLVPSGDAFDLNSRPNIGLKTTGPSPLLSIDSHFGLHPAMEALMPLWRDDLLAFVPQSGSPDSTRSHFDAQDFMESGAPGKKNIADGFLARALEAAPAPNDATTNSVRALALQSTLPRSLRGKFAAVSMNSIQDFKLKAEDRSFEQMYQGAADRLFRGVGHEAFETIATVQRASSDAKAAQASGLYPKSPIAQHLRDIAALIKARIGVQVAVTDMAGFDTHVRQGSDKGQLADRLRELSQAIAAFRNDLGNHFGDVTVVVSTEFGRTVRENGTGGTDHGHGSVILVTGGRVRGGIRGTWKDLKPGNLFEDRDVPVVTDYRLVMAEILSSTLKLEDSRKMKAIFPEFNFQPADFVGVLRS